MVVMMISTFAYSQQLPHYSLYMFNDAVINPAACGTKQYNTIHLISRSQWAGFEGAPKTQLLTYQRKQGNKIGLGATVLNDATGPISRTGAQLSYSYKMPVYKDYQLSFGLSGSIYQYLFDYDKVDLDPGTDVYDPAMPGGIEKVMTPEATFGMYMYNNNYYLGVSVPNLIESPINLPSLDEKTNKLIRHYFITSGYKFILNSDFIFQPSVLLKSTPVTPFQYDVNLMTRYRNQVWMGASYRDKDAVVIMLGMDYQEYTFGYSYDKSISDISAYTNGSHGVLLGYTFSRQKDSDGDGINDDKDDCPNEYGLKKNNGCPDSAQDIDGDGDGVNNDIDNCPKTPGPPENKGCPIITKQQKAIIDTAFANLEFVFGKAEITFSSYSHLERLGRLLNDYPEMRLKIVGHTDNIGEKEANMQLSKERSRAVEMFLTNRGIPITQIVTSYFGEIKPIATNDTKEGRAQNRRVEFTIFFE